MTCGIDMITNKKNRSNIIKKKLKKRGIYGENYKT